MLHFVVLGAGIFALFAVLDDAPPPAAADRLEVTTADAARLAATFEATWGRPPAADELAALVDRHVSEEVLVREARALGLDRDDAAVRQRLAQKMRFVLESVAEHEPSDADLRAHLAENPDRFLRPPLIAFEQVRLDDAGDADAALSRLREGAAPETLGARSLLPAAMPPSPPEVVDRTFGPDFFARLAALPPGEWQGPVQSAYGVHAVRIVVSTPGGLPPLDEIREAVARDWRAALREQMAQARIEALKARYEVILPDLDAAAANR
ncbi:peptidylprolyl isomerase [Albimonas sp. CAU 1670]|uniref:peptidylprolyl isomerase n=1 Tax=Albimonas sp. CAU 1670 TaxID=3032599 RepID=UPI0023DAADD0|nr:peptidylprolyl isomerase [Albimonas sp. CAU 1670]MDF2233812.1 peptidylprolyl isomerase [Albimonas sp. CAU 1670]